MTAHIGMNQTSSSFVRTDQDREREAAMTGLANEVRDGDVIEFTLHGERRTAEAMLVTEDGLALLDLYDGDRPAFARLADLDDVAIFRPDADELLAA
jgi:hypothetical protein